MAKSTYQEATLILQLAQWGASVGLSEATNWLWSDEFVTDYADFSNKYPRGSVGTLNAVKVCSYYESLGTLWKHGLLGEDLLFDWLAVSGVWDRIKTFALGVRREVGNPRLYENFEALAKADAAYQAKPTRAAKTKSRRKKTG